MELEKLVKEKIRSIDFDEMVIRVIRSLINNKIEKLIDEIAKKEVDEMIKKEMNDFINKPFDTDDGWGHHEHYEGFDEMFKKIFDKMKDVLIKIANEILK